MAEIKTPLIKLMPGEIFTADDDGAFVITEGHTYSDILRHIVEDIGDDTLFLVQMILDAGTQTSGGVDE